MAILKRLPGVVFFYKYRVISLCLLGSLLFYVFNESGILCSNHEVETAVNQVCQQYADGLVLGVLCEPLCKYSSLSTLTPLTCATGHAGKELVFSAKWDEQTVYIKTTGKRNNKSDSILEKILSEDDFRSRIQEVVSRKLNVTISKRQLENLLHLPPRPKNFSPGKRRLEQTHLLNLVQNQEYLLSVLFAEQDLFPLVYGTCGSIYAVEALVPPDLDKFYIFDGLKVWSSRMKHAILIMDLLEQLETDFPDPLRLCDIKMSHFGLTPLGRLKYLDLNFVHTDNHLQQIVGGGKPCEGDEDCDFFDCKASCNPYTRRCDLGVSNNNLQVVCEKIFVGWTLSGKLMVPGLLMTENTPASLTSLLRQCADTGRSAVPEDIRQRLYTTLTEMDQILSERIS